ncbi:NusG domain II-containing protein [Clostridium cochlearium]|uniref:NusG domain II-containing protein n=1 Tax=Clostridium cochlearium TaxID=1494 RepID=UPI000BBBCED9|nr:NusG domain II-containing protein [Clostridium cochlearium]
MKKLDKIFIIIIVILMIASILPIGILMFSKSNNENRNIIIKVSGEVKKSIPLSNEGKSKIYEFDFDGNIGYIEVENGRVRMLEMNKEICPNAICSDTGWINKGYQSIVCLPNSIIVTIEGSKDEEIDTKTY